MLNLEKLTYLTVFCLPVYLIKVSFFGIPTNCLEISIGVIFIWALISKISFKNLLKPSLKIAVGLILAGLLIATIANKNYTVGMGIIKGWFVAPFLFAFIAAQVLDSEEKRKKALLSYFWSASAVAAISLAYFLFQSLRYDGRLEAFFNSPNYLAMYLSPAIIIGILSIKKKIFHYISLLVILFSFYLTYSYMAWGSLILSIASVEFFRNKGQFLKSKVLWLSVIFVAIVVFLQQDNWKFKNLTVFSERSSVASRVMIWKSSEKIISDNWVWGIGPGNFQEKYLEYQKYFPPYLEWAVPHPHNLYLAFWLYGGLLGLFGFIDLIFLWFREIAKKEKNAIWFASLGIMLYFLLHGLADTTYFKNDLAVIFWLNFMILL